MDRLAAITGGARGVGLGYAAALLSAPPQDGPRWRVALLDVDVAAAASAAAALNAQHGAGRAIAVHCDVADAASFAAAWAAASTALGGGPLSLLVNNAGVIRPLFAETERVVAVNLVGAIRGTELALHAATDGLRRRADPPLDIVCTASTNGLVPADSDCAPVYCATKFGIIGLVRALAFAGPRFNVRVMAICPVTVDTPMTEGLLPDEVRAYLDAEGRGGVMPPSMVADVLLRLVRDRDPSLAGEVFTAHPSVAPDGGRIPLETGPGSALHHVGVWRASESPASAAYLDDAIKGIASGDVNGWSATVAARR